MEKINDFTYFASSRNIILCDSCWTEMELEAAKGIL